MISGDALERLTVQITADFDGLNASLAGVNRSVDRMAADVTAKTNKIGTAFSGLGSVVSGFVGGLVAGIGVQAVGALGDFARSTMAAADDLGDLAERLGLSTDAVQRLESAFVAAGASPALMQSAMDKLNIGIGAFLQNGGGPAKAAFEQLGIASQIASGQLAGGEQIFYAVAEAMQGVDSAAERARIATQLFGRGAGPDMIEVLSAGGDALRQYGAEAERLGLHLSEDLIEKTADARLEIERTKFQMGQFATVMTAQAITAISDFAEQLGPVIKQGQELGQRVMDFLRPAFEALAKAVVTLMSGPFGSALLTVLRAVATVAGGALVMGLNLAAQALTALVTAVDSVSRVIATLPGAIARVARELIDRLTATVQGLVGQFTAIGRQIIDGFIQGIRNGIGRAVGAVREFAANVAAAFRRHKDIDVRSPSRAFQYYGEMIATGLARGIRGASEQAVQALQDLASRLGTVMQRLLTPDEGMWNQFAEDMNTLNEGLRRGLITLDQYTEAVKRLREELNLAAEARLPEIKVPTSDVRPGVSYSRDASGNIIVGSRREAPGASGDISGAGTVRVETERATTYADAALEAVQDQELEYRDFWRRTFSDGLRAAASGDLGDYFERWWQDLLFDGMTNALNYFADSFSGWLSGAGGPGGGGFAGLLQGIGQIFGGFGGGGGGFGTGASGGGFGGLGRGGSMSTVPNVHVMIGNEALDSRFMRIAGGTAAQAYSASRAQVPLDLTRAQRNRIW